MCDRRASFTDPTADFVLSDLLTATEDLLDFSINVLDTIRLQSHFNDRNRRVNLAAQLQEVADGLNDSSNRSCTVTTTLKYDLSLYVDRVLQACKRTKANLLLLRVSRTRSTNSSLLLVASTHVRVEQLNQKLQLLNRLVKENGGEFPTKKKKKKKEPSKTQLENQTTEVKAEAEEAKPVKTIPPPPPVEKKPASNSLSKEDLTDYVEIALSFRMLIAKYREFIQQIRASARSNLSSTGQASLINSIVLIPIAANAIDELNNILNRLIRIAFTAEAESNYLRQISSNPTPTENTELYRQGATKQSQQHREDPSGEETHSLNPMISTERFGSSRTMTPRQASSGSNLKRNHLSLLKQNDSRPNTRNQSAAPLMNTPHRFNVTDPQSFQLTADMIANIFEDFFIQSKTFE